MNRFLNWILAMTRISLLLLLAALINGEDDDGPATAEMPPAPAPFRSPYAALSVPFEGELIVGQSVAYTVEVFTGDLDADAFAALHTESYVCLELVGESEGAHFCHRLFGENVTDIRMLRVPYGFHTVATHLMDARTRALLPETRQLRHFETTDEMEAIAPPEGTPNATASEPVEADEAQETISTPKLAIVKPPSRAAVQMSAGVDFKLQVHAADGEAFARLFSSERGGAAALCLGPGDAGVCATWPVVGLAHPPRLVLAPGSHAVRAMLVHPTTGALIEPSASALRSVFARNATTFRDRGTTDSDLLAAEINVDGVLMPIVLEDAGGDDALEKAAARFCVDNDIVTANCVPSIAALLATL